MRSRFHFLAPRGLGAAYRAGSYPLPDPGRTIRPMFDSSFIPPSLRPAPAKGVRGFRGLGDQPLLNAGTEPIQLVTVLDPSVIAAKVATGQPLTSQETSLWSGLTPTARGVYTILPTQIVAAQSSPTQRAGVPVPSASWFDKSTSLLGYVIPNKYLAGGGVAGFLLLALAGGKKGRGR